MEEDMPEETSEASEITTVQLLAARRDKLAHEKLRIGALCSSLLENPEKKVLYCLLNNDILLLIFLLSCPLYGVYLAWATVSFVVSFQLILLEITIRQ